MRLRIPPTLAAAVLLAAAVAIPCSAWYVMGSRSVEQEGRDLVAGAARDGERVAARLAERMRERLAAIVRGETRRPYYQYRNVYPDLTENCECAGWIESPLAGGPADPFVLVHFEIDATRKLTIPTLPCDEDPALLPEHAAEQRRLLERLQPAAGAMLRAVWKAESPPAPDFSGALVPAAAAAPAEADSANRADSGGAVLVNWGGMTAVVEPFTWHTLEIAGRPELVAMRAVRSPEGSRVQGLVISREEVRSSFASEALPAELRPDRDDEPGLVTESLRLDDADWEVAVDPGAAVTEARERGASLARGFRRTFWGGTGGAVLAAILVVGLVGQSERLARQRSRFAASAAHELRTPLAGLRMYGDMLAEGLGDPRAGRDYARQISAEAERLGRVVSNVLGYTRLERGRPLGNPAPAHPGPAVREAVERMRPAIESAGATLELAVEEPLPRVPLDRDALDQILQNLVDNAERYSRGTADRAIRVSLRRAGGGGVALAVSDHGPGVARRERKRLFRPFARGEDPEAPAGLGLGLALVAGLVDAHRGSVRYDDAPGGGSVFTVIFPS